LPAMLDANEAAKKIAAASLEARRARAVHADPEKIKAAEHRLALLLRLFASSLPARNGGAWQVCLKRSVAVVPSPTVVRVAARNEEVANLPGFVHFRASANHNQSLA
jgi:hypothetical protein